MPWGDEGVTKLQYKQDSVTAWGSIGAPKSVPVTKAGIIKNLRMIQGGGALTLGGGAVASIRGPYNAYTRHELMANSQQAIFGTSGYGMFLIECVKRGLEQGLPPRNTTLGSPPSVTDQEYVFDGRDVTAPTSYNSGTANTQWNWSLNLPVSQLIRSLGGDIGQIPMSTENAQLSYNFTPFAASVSGTTYTIGIASATDDLNTPYNSSSSTTIAAPSLDLMRIMYEPVLNEADFPNFDFVSQWLEEQPATFSGTTFTWKQNQDAGVLARLIFGVYTSTAPFGIGTDKLTNAAALQLSYNTDIPKFKENGLEALARQRDQLGFDLPQGFFMYDLLGPDLTLSDVMNTYVVPAIQLQMTYTSVTLNTSINPIVIAQRFLPIRVA